MIKIKEKDITILRRLAEKQAKIASLPIHKEKIDLWSKLNKLEKVRPLVWINEEPWHEMNVNNELTLQTEDEFCREIEFQLRTTIYQWEHTRADMIVEPKFYSPYMFHDTGFGLEIKENTILQDTRGGISSHYYEPQIKSEEDVKKIKMPEVIVDLEETERRYQTLTKFFGDILKVEKIGIRNFWFAAWDLLVQWWGVSESLMDLVEKPELVHMIMDRLTNAYLHLLEQYEKLGLLSLNNTNIRIGSGGLGYTDELPQTDFDLAHVRTKDQWGFATAQIFSDVSPAMHEEFALQYERRWLERFGLTYYGCCDPLHKKIDILKSVKNLRKISMSAWVDLDIAAKNLGIDYVFSYKPSPAILAGDKWNPEQVRKDLELVLEKTKGCIVEIIMKDISTIHNEPVRLWEWQSIAMQVVENHKI